MLMSMRSQTEAARALAYVGAGHQRRGPPPSPTRRRARPTWRCTNTWCPIIKGWSTEMSQDVTRDGVQVHGGMGFIEETGAAQHYRDAKILTIYEGTTAIQANDLVGRKTVRDGGAVAKAIIAQVRATEAQLARADGRRLPGDAARSWPKAARRWKRWSSTWSANMKTDIKGVFSGSVPYLKLAGIVLGGWQMARAALVAQQKLDEGERRRRVLQGQDRHRALLCRPHPVAGVGPAHRDRRRQRRRAGADRRPVLTGVRPPRPLTPSFDVSVGEGLTPAVC